MMSNKKRLSDHPIIWSAQASDTQLFASPSQFFWWRSIRFTAVSLSFPSSQWQTSGVSCNLEPLWRDWDFVCHLQTPPPTADIYLYTYMGLQLPLASVLHGGPREEITSWGVVRSWLMYFWAACEGARVTLLAQLLLITIIVLLLYTELARPHRKMHHYTWTC